MNLNRKLILRACNVLKRSYSAKPRKIVEIQEEYKEKLDNNEIKARKHPGRLSLKNIVFPENVSVAVQKYLSDTPIKSIVKDSVELVNYLRSRHPPPEAWESQSKQKEVFEEIIRNQNIDISTQTPENLEELGKRYNGKIQKTIKERLYSWKPIEYDQYTSYKYLLGRSSAEYAVIRMIFEEIKVRSEGFTPVTYFDFGSGVGTGLWALTDCWSKNMSEYVMVDISQDMGNISRDIFISAYKSRKIKQESIFHRRFLSVASPQYDIVLCAYSLFEMPSSTDRLRTILNLWNKTKDFLVIVEQGTNAGFNLINEARDFILETSAQADKGYAFAPCPHDKPCPRFSTDNTPCNFLVNYTGMKLLTMKEQQTEAYSYVVLRKGERPDGNAWPRIVRATLLRSGHTICRICRDNGKLDEIIFTKSKHGKIAYRCAKNSLWGDLLPIKITDPVPDQDNDL